MPRRSAGAILSVPMSKPRYTAVESQLMISPPRRSATVRASALLPVAVGPRIAISGLGMHHRGSVTELPSTTEDAGDRRKNRVAFHPSTLRESQGRPEQRRGATMLVPRLGSGRPCIVEGSIGRRAGN